MTVQCGVNLAEPASDILGKITAPGSAPPGTPLSAARGWRAPAVMPERMVRSASRSGRPDCRVASARAVITAASGRRPAVANWPGLKAARFKVELRAFGSSGSAPGLVPQGFHRVGDD